MRRGDRIREWELVRRLGKGGSGEVWQGKGADGAIVAIKFLREDAGQKRYSRFRDEIEVLVKLGRHPGILPMIAYALPEKPSAGERPWLATPLATLLRKVLEQANDKFRPVVEAIHTIAITLAELHDLGIAHRDVKPENLFQYEGRAVIGDFGLVAYPEKNAVTLPGDRVGPLYYLAPEIMTDAAENDPCPADVYSLAKTLWVLGTGQRFPLQGELRTDTDALRLSTYVDDDRAPMLDQLIERATRHDPAKRPTMQDVASELSDWLNPTLPATAPDLSGVRARLRSAIATAKQNEARHNKRTKLAQQMHQRLRTVVDEVYQLIEAETGIRPSINHTKLDARLEVKASEQQKLPARHFRYGLTVQSSSTQYGVTAYLEGGFHLIVFADEPAELRCGFLSHTNYDSKGKEGFCGEGKWQFDIPSSKQENAIAEMNNRLKALLPKALSAFQEIISNPWTPTK